MIEFVKKCPKCGNDMILSGIDDQTTGEKKNIYICQTAGCDYTEPAPETFEGGS